MPKRPTVEQYRNAAKRLHHVEGETEIDEDARISRPAADEPEDRAYVQAWVWVPIEEACSETKD